MAVSGLATRPGWPEEAAARLQSQTAKALRQARETGAPQLVSVTMRVATTLDPSALIAGARRTGEPWFCFEQPEREGFALAALGCVRALESAGARRFEAVSDAWHAVVSRAITDFDGGPPGSGLVAVGGFAFAPDGGASPTWNGFAPASLVVPELSVVRSGGESWVTLTATVAPDDTESDVSARARRRLSECSRGQLPLMDPAPAGSYRIVSPMPPAHYEEAVARAVARIRGGELEKIVLARQVDVHAPRPHDPAAVLGVLRECFESSFVFAVGRGDATFVGATPELLIRSQGQRASTVALAGSARRSADPAVDDHLAEALLRSDKDRHENAIVARRIERALRPHAVWVAAAPEPAVVKVANIQHLACPIRAQLASPLGALTLAGALHPTPAIGAEPASAVELIPALEGFDRGWYAGAVGWTDSSGDGEFCVALRSALLRDQLACCYAGCGIVADSEPAAELAESELKLQVMLPVLAG